MGPDAQRQAVQNLRRITRIHMLPHEWLNETLLDEYVTGLTMDPLDHFKNVLNKQRFLYDHVLSAINKESPQNWWNKFSQFSYPNAEYHKTYIGMDYI